MQLSRGFSVIAVLIIGGALVLSGSLMTYLAEPYLAGDNLGASVLFEYQGGTGEGTYTEGDILYSDATNSLDKLGIGSNGQVLKVSGGNVSWGTDTSGSVASNSIDFDEMVDAMTLDANLSVASGSGPFNTTWHGGFFLQDTASVAGKLELDGDVAIDTANGIDVNPGSDTDADLITVGVTGTPVLSWDETQDAFKFSKGIDIDDNIALTFGTGFDATMLWDGTDLVMDYDSAAGGTTDFRLQEDGTDRLTVLTGGNVGIGITSPGQLLDVAANGDIGFAGTAILSDSAGTMTLSNVDALGATTESTVESAIDTLANLTSVQGQTISLSGDLTVESASLVNQDLTTDATPTFAGADVSGGTLTVGTLSGSIDAGGATSLEVVNGTAPTVNATGEVALDTTDNQLLIGDSGGSAKVLRLTDRLFSVTIASTSVAFSDGGVLPIPPERDGYEMTEFSCYVSGGTSVVVNVSDGTNDTETITCATTITTDTDVATNDTATAGELMELQIGTITGSPNYLSFTAFGVYTRE